MVIVRILYNTVVILILWIMCIEKYNLQDAVEQNNLKAKWSDTNGQIQKVTMLRSCILVSKVDRPLVSKGIESTLEAFYVMYSLVVAMVCMTSQIVMPSFVFYSLTLFIHLFIVYVWEAMRCNSTMLKIVANKRWAMMLVCCSDIFDNVNLYNEHWTETSCNTGENLTYNNTRIFSKSC